MKLIDLAGKAVELLKESGDEGIRSDILAEQLGTPKRRVYDVIAVLRSIGQVSTKRKFDGTTVTWIDSTKDFVPREEFQAKCTKLDEADRERAELQVQVAELKMQLQTAKTKLRRDVKAVECASKTEFNTTQLNVRALSSTGIKRVRNIGLEVIIETHDPGMIADPTETETDESQILLKNLQKI